MTATDVDDRYFGRFGGRYAAEPLMSAIDDLDRAWRQAWQSTEFHAKFDGLLKDYAGRPSLLTEVPRFAEGTGARIFLKREDLNHTGSHKINNVLGQALLTQMLGKKRVIAETGAGQHGVATATAAALLGLECTIYMGVEDTARQALNVARMQVLGAEVIGVTQGSQTLKDAINEAFRDWVTNVSTTNYIFGTASGPHPFPTIVRELQSVIGKEARQQILEQTGSLPDAVFACVGGGSNAAGTFAPFEDDTSVQLVGAEAAGDGVGTGRTAATISEGKIGILHGARTFVLQERDGQTKASHSISAGLDYPGVGPQHAYWSQTGRVQYVPVTDAAAMDAFMRLSRTEGIIPAIESAHALAAALDWAGQQDGPRTIIVTLSGRGDKDMETAASYFGLGTPEFDVVDPSAQGGKSKVEVQK